MNFSVYKARFFITECALYIWRKERVKCGGFFWNFYTFFSIIRIDELICGYHCYMLLLFKGIPTVWRL